MNISGGNTLPNIGRRINWQVVALASGLAVAITAGAVAGVFDRDSTPAETAATRPAAEQPIAQPAPSTGVQPGEPVEMTYILVGSQQEADLLKSVISTDSAALPELAEQADLIEIVAIETAQEQREFDNAVNMSAMELMMIGKSLNVVNLRTSEAPGLPVVYVVGSESERELLQQGLSASDSNASVFVIEKGTLQGDFLYNTVVGEQMEAGTFDIVDLRE